jgi:hypothetical protein
VRQQKDESVSFVKRVNLCAASVAVRLDKNSHLARLRPTKEECHEDMEKSWSRSTSVCELCRVFLFFSR